MDYTRKPTQSRNEQYNSVGRRNQGRGYTTSFNNQTRERPPYSAHFSRNQSNEESSKTKILRPPIPKPHNFKGYSNIASYSQFTTQTKKIETLEEKKIKLTSQLNRFESPFIWKPRQVRPVNEPETIIKRMQEKDREVRDERKFKWNKFIYHLVISYELWRAKKLPQAFEEVCGLESLLREGSNRGDFMFACTEDALWHVVNVSKAFLFLEQDMVTQAEHSMEAVFPKHMMNRSNKASIHGIRAAVFMEYGHRGNKNALEEACEACKLDRTVAEWHFYVCKCMGRIRRVAQCHELVDHEEVKAINRAIKLEPGNVSYKVVLAQVLTERAFREYKKYYPGKKSEQYIRIKKTNKAAMHIFKKAVELSPNSPHILMRCARGLMKLPPGLKDLNFTKGCIDKALELAPNNPMVHHVKGMYHERYDCDVELPMQAYEKAASLDNFGAAMDQVRLHHKLRTGNIVEELEELETKYEQVDRRQVIYTQAGSYLLFIKKDIIGALKYYLKVIEIDSKSYAMMSHKPIFFRLRDPVNMFDVMLEELGSKTDKESFSLEERQVMREFTIKAREHQPLPTEERKRLTVEEILNLSRQVVESDDLYKESMATGKKRRWSKAKQNKRNRKWYGKNKGRKMENKVKNNTNENVCHDGSIIKEKHNLSEKLCPDGKKVNQMTKNIETNVERKRRDSVSSVNTVDSDYHRDSTLFGPRKFFPCGSNESLCSTKMERVNPNEQGNHISQGKGLHLVREYSEPVSRNLHSRASRDSSISSMSSVGSNIEGGDIVYPPTNTTEESQLTVENLKKHDVENSYETGVRRLSMFTLSNASSESLASSSNTMSVMDRVKQSYAMLGRNSEQTRGKKKNVRNYGSTQSLNTQHTGDRKKTLGDKNIDRSGSSQSLNVLEGNLDSKFSKSFRSQESSIGSSRSFSFLPDFARKN